MQVIQTPAVNGSRLPRINSMPNGDVLMSWVEPLNKGHTLKFAVLHNGHWIRQGEVTHGENWFVNWADYPSVVVVDANLWLAHWLVKQKGGKTFDYDIRLAISDDAGNSWREIGSPHRDGTASEHGFVTIFKDADAAGVIWLDGRDYLKKDERARYPEKSGNFNLRYTHINRDGTMGPEAIIDTNTCTCCWTSVATTEKGAVAVWRSRTRDEIRDNKLALMRAGKWEAPAPLGAEGWMIEGCPVNGPSVAARGHIVVAAWFTAQGDKPRVRAAFSMNDGETFGTPIEIDDMAPLGRIGLAWRDNQTALISWMTASNQNKKSSLAIRSVKKDGTLGLTRHIFELSPGRDVGVPQMVVAEKGVLLAWTDVAPHYGIKMVMIDWKAIQSDKVKDKDKDKDKDPQSNWHQSDLLSKFSTDKNTIGHHAQTFTAYICSRKH